MDQSKSDAVVEMYEANTPIADICADLSLWPQQVYQELRKRGVGLRRTRARTRALPEDVQELIVKLWPTHPNVADIARITMLPYHQVYLVVKEKQLKKPRKRIEGDGVASTILELATERGTTTYEILKELEETNAPSELKTAKAIIAISKAVLERISTALPPNAINWDAFFDSQP